MKQNPEAKLAKLVVEHFEKLGYTTYKEVSLAGGGTIRADVYCKNDKETIAIEIKMNMGLKIIEQGFKWREHANKVYIVLPSKRINHFSEQICQDYGIGLLLVTNSGHFTERVTPSITKEPQEPQLFEEQLLSEASNNKGEFVTPFKITVTKLMDYVGDQKLVLKNVVENIDHHYRTNDSAIGCIKQMVKIGVIDMKITKENNKIWISKCSK